MKAIALLSGGLDSTLAIKLIKDQGIHVTALNFTSPFCTCTAKNSSCSAAAAAAKRMDVPLKVIAKGMDYFKIVENPKFGYGSCMNPCIDCRIYIFKKAKELMENEGASFLISGEVVGQRPMSQKKITLACIEREAGVEGILLRPLSAKILKPTIPEKEGIVDRSKLLGINGRGRRKQIEMADEEGIDYPCPAGGCLLTDKYIARRLKDLFAHKPGYTIDDIRLLRYGRHIRISPGLKIVVAKDEEDAAKIRNHFNEKTDVLIECVAPQGPYVLMKDFQGTIDRKVLAVTRRYSDAKNGESLAVVCRGVFQGEYLVSDTISDEELSSIAI